MTVFQSTIANQLKDTLDGVQTDKSDGLEAKATYKKIVEVGNMPDAYLDDLEMGGPALLSVKAEGTEIQSLNLNEGSLTRYIPRVLAGKITITQEAMDDGKYPESINMSRHLKRSGVLTIEYDWGIYFGRATSTSQLGGDGQPWASASHTLPGGGTFSNMLGTPAALSVIALTNAFAQLMQMPGLDGLITPVMPKQVVYPVQLWGTAMTIKNSTMDPAAGNFSATNVIKDEHSDIDWRPEPFWTATTTKWFVGTDAEKGFRHLWKKKYATRTWVDNDNMVMKHAASQRYAIGHTNARGMLFSDS
jgi:hypothetical protein